MLKRNLSGRAQSQDSGIASGTHPSSSSALKSRLQDAAQAIEGAGLRNMPWKPVADTPLAPKVIDIEWLSNQRLLPFLVNHIPPTLLYQSLMAHGLTDSIEVLEWLRKEQLVAVLDYDLWLKESDETQLDVSPERFLEWLRAWFEIGAEFAAERFYDLEEEVIIALVTKLFDIQPIGVSVSAEHQTEQGWTAVDGKFHLQVKLDNPEAFELLHALVDALYRRDVKLAGSVFSHASMLVRNESLEDATRWRNGRLADMGFVSPDEAASLLRYQNVAAVMNDIRSVEELEKKRVAAGLGTQTREAWETEIDGHLRMLEQLPEEVLRSEVISLLGVEKIAQLSDGRVPSASEMVLDDELMLEAAETIAAQCARLLSILDTQDLKTSKQSESIEVERAIAYVARTNEEAASALKSRIARVTNSFVAATVQGFDADALARAISVVRGAMNIGLLAIATERGFAKETSDADLAGLLGSVGPEFLFRLGWSVLAELSMQAARILQENFDAESSKAYKMAELVKSGRFAEIRKWLSTLENRLASPVFFVLSSVLNRVPIFPEVLNASAAQLKAEASRRPFENLNDVEVTNKFIANLAANLTAI